LVIPLGLLALTAQVLPVEDPTARGRARARPSPPCRALELRKVNRRKTCAVSQDRLDESIHFGQPVGTEIPQRAPQGENSGAASR
jgi:hypothetical protein